MKKHQPTVEKQIDTILLEMLYRITPINPLAVVKKKILALLAQEKETLLEKVEKEVIGEDQIAVSWRNPLTGAPSKTGRRSKKFGQQVTSLSAQQGNKLRAEQRTKLEALRGERK